LKLREFKSATITFDSESVLLVRFKNDVYVDVEEAKKLVVASLEMVSGKSFYLLVDARDILSSIDHESRKYIADHKEYNDLNVAQSIIVNNMPIRLLAQFYYKVYQHKNPVKIFSTMEEGKKWLLSHSLPGVNSSKELSL